MKLEKLAGATSEIWQIFVRDSSSTTGGGLTGLAFNTASLTAYYHRDTDTTATAISLVTMTVGTFTSSGFKEIDATNMPGWYQFCPPNAALASGAKSCAFHLKGATNMAPLPIEVQLVAYNPDAALATPTNITAATGITVATNNDKTGYSLSQAFPANFSSLAITGGGAVTAGTVSDKTGYSLTQTFPANFSALSISAGGVVAASGNWSIAGDAMTLTAAYNAAKTASQVVATDIVSGGAITTSGGFASADVKKVNAVTVNGLGTAGSPWGP